MPETPIVGTHPADLIVVVSGLLGSRLARRGDDGDLSVVDPLGALHRPTGWPRRRARTLCPLKEKLIPR